MLTTRAIPPYLNLIAGPLEPNPRPAEHYLPWAVLALALVASPIANAADFAFQRVDTVDAFTNPPRVRINSTTNSPELIYFRQGVRHATLSGGEWQVDSLPISEANAPTDFAIDTQGHLHLHFGALISGNMPYYTNATGGWTTETSAFGSSPSLALDPVTQAPASLLFKKSQPIIAPGLSTPSRLI